MDSSKIILGSGISFPLVLDHLGKVVIDDHEVLIERSIRAILSWPTSTRPFTPPFGSRIWEVIGEPNDTITESLVKLFIIEAINTWENRISLLEVNVNKPDSHILNIELVYLINSTQKVKDLNFQYVV